MELAATAEGKITARARAADGGDGRLPPARHAGHPDPRRLALRAAATTSRATTSSASASSRTRRRPTPTAAPAGRRRPTRSSGPSTRSRGKLGKDPVELRRLNFITEFPATIARRPHVRLRRLRAHRSTRRSSSSATRRCAREQAERRERGDTEAARDRLLAPTSRCAGSRRRGSSAALRYGAGGWDAATVRFLPTGTVQVI